MKKKLYLKPSTDIVETMIETNLLAALSVETENKDGDGNSEGPGMGGNLAPRRRNLWNSDDDE